MEKKAAVESKYSDDRYLAFLFFTSSSSSFVAT
jgi:hypothetical protein